MTARVTLHDVAQAAGVSAATVDRVLNDRSGVHARTRAKVVTAATRLGYLAEAPGGAPQPVDLVFLLPAGANSLMTRLHDQLIAQAAQAPGVTVRVEMLASFSPSAVAARLADLAGTVDGIGLVAQDHPQVRAAIRSLARSRTELVTLLSDIQNVPRRAYVGIDNRQAGRLAGQMLGRLIGPGTAKVALFAGSLTYRGHEEREMGFRTLLAEEFPDLRIVDVREILDDPTRARAEARRLLDQHPDLAGIYNLGAATLGIAEEVRARGLSRQIVLIGHEVSEATVPLLLDGTVDAVIDQNPRVEAREALAILIHAARGQPYAYIPPRLQLVLKENLPED